MTRIKRGCSTKTDALEAVAELRGAIAQENSITVIFASSRYDLETLGKALKDSFSGTIIGCTTAGEITARGYLEGALAGFSIQSDALQVETHLLPDLPMLGAAETEELANVVQGWLTDTKGTWPDARSFGLLLIDGMSIREEQVMAILGNAAEELPIIGGSAGDDQAFAATHVYWDGEFVSDVAVFSLFTTTLPFIPFKTQHFTASDTRVVISEADAERRIVKEINGRPAALEYARIIGVDLVDLKPTIFSNHPLMLRFGGENYVRSIQQVNDDHSLTFYCAIEEGLVLRVAEGVNLVENLENAFCEVREQLDGQIMLTLGCDCILRRIEVFSKGLREGVEAIFERNNVIGFNTYGEQFNSVHVNQTFTGIALGGA